MAARTLDKCRADLADRAGSYHYNCPLDRALFNFTGIDAEEFKDFVATGAGDEEARNGSSKSRRFEIQIAWPNGIANSV
jgi:Domain of unknown function (DUF5069)